jgi:hypothetical protein
VKAISVREPWAWLLVHADEYPDPKRVENRTWPTQMRGAVLVHAGKRFDRNGYESVLAMRPELASVLPSLGDFALGGVVGWADLDACVKESESRWFTGKYGFVFRHAAPLPFVPWTGRLGFFDIPVRALGAAGERIRNEVAQVAAIERRRSILSLADRGMTIEDIARELRLPLAHVVREMDRVRREVEGGLFTPALLPIETAALGGF